MNNSSQGFLSQRDTLNSEMTMYSSQMKTATLQTLANNFSNDLKFLSSLKIEQFAELVMDKVQSYLTTEAVNEIQISEFPAIVWQLAQKKEIDLNNLEGLEKRQIQNLYTELEEVKREVKDWLDQFISQAKQSSYQRVNDHQVQEELQRLKVENEQLKSQLQDARCDEIVNLQRRLETLAKDLQEEQQKTAQLEEEKNSLFADFKVNSDYLQEELQKNEQLKSQEKRLSAELEATKNDLLQERQTLEKQKERFLTVEAELRNTILSFSAGTRIRRIMRKISKPRYYSTNVNDQYFCQDITQKMREQHAPRKVHNQFKDTCQLLQQIRALNRQNNKLAASLGQANNEKENAKVNLERAQQEITRQQIRIGNSIDVPRMILRMARGFKNAQKVSQKIQEKQLMIKPLQ